MATHYKGERITELLQRIEELKVILDTNQDNVSADEALRVIEAYASLAIYKAKLTALQGE